MLLWGKTSSAFGRSPRVDMRLLVLVSGLTLAAACRDPSPMPVATPSPSSSPLVTRQAPDAVAWSTRAERLGVPGCDEPFAIPVVTQPRPLAESVTAWVQEELAERRWQLAGAEGCRLPETKMPADVRRVRGFVTVSFWAPDATDAKFFFPIELTFSLRTGEPFSRVVAEEKREALLEQIGPRYRAAMEQWLQRKDVDPECQTVLDAYRPSLDDFAVTEKGITFRGWTSLPTSARACVPQDEPVLAFEEIDPFLTPEARAAWREE